MRTVSPTVDRSVGNCLAVQCCDDEVKENALEGDCGDLVRSHLD